MKEADEINKVLDRIYDVATTDKGTECQKKLDDIEEIIKNSPNTRSLSEICKVIEGGKSKSKSKTKKKKNYKKKTKTRSKRKTKNKRNKRRKTYKNKKMG